ncbi:MAG TPA: GEVED domain-containing protein, partial [Bacteroidia bacterium]|nr:GEVED domain-containing protein [Bacteroidia bacterium]
MNSKLYTKIYSIILLLIIGIRVNAQVSNYAFMQGVYTDYSQYYVPGNSSPNPSYAYQESLYSPNTSVNPLKILYTGNDTGTTATSATGNGYPIGFNFIYNGESFDRVAISGNGYIKLGHSGQSIAIKSDTLSGEIFDGSSDNQNVLASFQTDATSLFPNNNTPFMFTYGLPGNRTFVVQFSDVTNATGIILVHQIQLMERNGIVGFAYPSGGYDLFNTPIQGAIGFTGNNDLTNLKIVSGTNTWQTATQGTSPTDLCDFNSSVQPPGVCCTNQSFMYIWTPPTPTPSVPTCPYAYLYNVNTSNYPNALYGGAIGYATYAYFLPLNNATNILTNSTLTWSDISASSNQPTTYNVYLDIVNPPEIQVARNLSATSFTPATLAPNTKYYYEIVPKNASGEDSGCIGSFTTDSIQQYCPVFYNSGRINSFAVNTLSFIASNSNDQGKLPAISPYITSLKRDTTYNCTITLNSFNANTYPFSNTTDVAVWIDFNQNGNFNDPGEALGNGSAGLNGTITFPITIPDTAKLGATIMRLAWKGDNF